MAIRNAEKRTSAHALNSIEIGEFDLTSVLKTGLPLSMSDASRCQSKIRCLARTRSWLKKSKFPSYNRRLEIQLRTNTHTKKMGWAALTGKTEIRNGHMADSRKNRCNLHCSCGQ